MRVIVTLVIFWIGFIIFYLNTGAGQERLRCGTVVEKYDHIKYIGKHHDTAKHLYELTIRFDDTQQIELIEVTADTLVNSKENQSICIDFGNIWDVFTFIMIGIFISCILFAFTLLTYIE